MNGLLLVSFGLWCMALTCHARLQPAWMRRFPTERPAWLSHTMSAARLLLPLLGLLLLTTHWGARGCVGWLGSGSVAGVTVALFHARLAGARKGGKRKSPVSA